MDSTTRSANATLAALLAAEMAKQAAIAVAKDTLRTNASSDRDPFGWPCAEPSF